MKTYRRQRAALWHRRGARQLRMYRTLARQTLASGRPNVLYYGEGWRERAEADIQVANKLLERNS